jgi:DNA-binding LytR/AlgR family response regulator
MNAIIVEDESLIAKELQAKIKWVAEDVEVLQVLPSVKTAKKYFLENAEPDILIMDIQLGDGISFEILEQYELKCPIVFTTAYDEYAIRAFKVNSVDYLLKPVDEDELKKAIDKCRERIEKKGTSADITGLMANIQQSKSGKMLYKEKFISTFRNHWIPVNVEDIACFMRDNLNYMVTFSGELYVLDYNTMEEIEELIDPNLYYRTNRQFIIHIEAIRSVKPHENQKLTVTLIDPLKHEVDISREKAPGFKKWFDR